jgi:hypothetical protein
LVRDGLSGPIPPQPDGDTTPAAEETASDSSIHTTRETTIPCTLHETRKRLPEPDSGISVNGDECQGPVSSEVQCHASGVCEAHVRRRWHVDLTKLAPAFGVGQDALEASQWSTGKGCQSWMAMQHVPLPRDESTLVADRKSAAWQNHDNCS